MNARQRGVTLVELLITIGVSAILITGLTTGIVQVIRSSAGSFAHMSTIKEVENAVYWINHDAQMANSINGQNITGAKVIGTNYASPAGFSSPQAFKTNPLTLAWTNTFEPANAGSVTYSVSADNTSLLRTFVPASPGLPATTSIIPHVDISSVQKTGWSYIPRQYDADTGAMLSEGHFVLTVTSTVGGSRPGTETRSITVVPRVTP